ncbi:MAG: M1 family aminopeptidase [Candidatus Acetothermia bacterium]
MFSLPEQSKFWPIVLLLILAFNGTSLVVPGTVSMAQGAEKRAYQIEASFDPSTHTIKGTMRVSFTNDLEQAVDRALFLLRPNLLREKNPHLSAQAIAETYPQGFDPGWIEIGSISDEEGTRLDHQLEDLPPATQTYSLEDTILNVNLDNSLAPGESKIIKLKFTTKFPYRKGGDNSRYRETYTWRFGWYPLLTPTSWWIPGNEQLLSGVEFPTGDYEVKLNTPEEWTVALGDDEDATTSDVSEDSELSRISLKEARSAPLFLSSRHSTYELTHPKVKIQVHHLPGYENEAKLLASYAQEVIEYYSERFGAYPRDELTLVQSTQPGQYGMAADGLIILGNSVFTDQNLTFSPLINRLLDYLVAHEVGHQWFGMGVGADLNRYNWISEAFAEFLAVSYFEDKYGANGGNLFRFERSGLLRGALESQIGYVNLREHTFELPYLMAFRDEFDEAIIKPNAEVKYANYNQVRLYKKGYLVLRTLQNKLGEAEMDKFVSESYSFYRDEIVDVNQLQEIAEEVSGQDLDELFGPWLYTDGFLDYQVEGLNSEKGEDGDYSNKIRLAKTGDLVSPVEMETVTAAGEKDRREVTLSEDTQTIELTTSTPIEKVALDPDDMVMDVNRLNNYYPRKIHLSLSDNALPLDAYLISMGPSGISGSIPGDHRWQIGPGFVAGTADLNRNLSLSGSGRLVGDLGTDPNFEASLTAARQTWNHPQTGYPGKYWEPGGATSLKLGRSVSNSGSVFHYLTADWQTRRQLQDQQSFRARGTVSPRGFNQVDVQAEETVNILPALDFTAQSFLGLSRGEVPNSFQYNLDNYHSYGSWEQDSLGVKTWQPAHFTGNHKLNFKGSLTFPLSRDIHYFIGNLAVITDVHQSIWAQAGNVWKDIESIDPQSLKHEFGFTFTISAKALGGLLPIDLDIGYAYHGKGVGRHFIEVYLGSQEGI